MVIEVKQSFCLTGKSGAAGVSLTKLKIKTG